MTEQEATADTCAGSAKEEESGNILNEILEVNIDEVEEDVVDQQSQQHAAPQESSAKPAKTMELEEDEGAPGDADDDDDDVKADTGNGDVEEEEEELENEAERNLIVNYLPYTLNDEGFKMLFATFGEIEEIRLMKDRLRGT